MSLLTQAIAVLGVLGPALQLVPGVGEKLKAATELASKICEHINTMKGNREAYEELGTRAASLLAAIANELQKAGPDRLQGMMGNVNGLLAVLEQIGTAVENRVAAAPAPVRKRDRVKAALNRGSEDMKRFSKDKEEVAKFRRQLEQVVQEFQVSSHMRSELTLDAVRKVATDLQQHLVRIEGAQSKAAMDADNAVLASLMPIGSAAWDMIDTPLCMENTRTALLADIWAWIESSSDTVVFWLNGLAGTGKSTVARSVCHRLAQEGLLGASFFVSRQQADRRDAANIIRTIAYQLAVRNSAFKNAACTALRERPELTMARPLHEQVSQLLLRPAQSLSSGPGLVLVVDALDECFTDVRGRHGGQLLPILVRGLLTLSGRLKLFITSRAEPTIQRDFEELASSAQQKVTRLHDLDHGMVENDIRTYLTGSFSEIVTERRSAQLASWPPPGIIEVLVKRSAALFVYAATAVRFVGDVQYSPRARLDFLLAHQEGKQVAKSPYRMLDNLYLQVLVDAVRTQGDDADDLCRRLRTIVGAVILLRYPLLADALASLLDLDADETQLVLERLSAVVLLESGVPVRTFHPSFPEFMTDSGRCGDLRFFVSASLHHGQLAHRCLAIMNQHLRYDICEIRDPSIANAEVPNLDARLRSHVPEELRYACHCWVFHLPDASTLNELKKDLHEFVNRHLLHWIELLSLLGSLVSVELGLPRVIAWLKEHASSAEPSPTSSLLGDALRIAQVYATPIKSHALHVYYSAYSTMPHCLLLDTVTSTGTPSSLPKLVSPRAPNWGASVKILEGHGGPLQSVAISRDGTRIVSGSLDGTIRLWDHTAFEELEKVDAHTEYVCAVALSPDGTRVASAGTDAMVRLWDAATLQELATLQGHDLSVTCVAFSADNARIFSGSHDWTVRVWGGSIFQEVAILMGHINFVTSVVGSPDGLRLVSGSRDCTLRVWDAVTYTQISVLKGHTAAVNSVAFSPDSTRIASGSDDTSVCLWDALTYKTLARLKGHTETVLSVAFSFDGNHIVSGSHDHTIRLWDAVAHQELARLPDFTDTIFSVTFSPDDTQIISGDDSSAVRVWDAAALRQTAALDLITIRPYMQEATSLVFSPNGSHLVMGLGDHTLLVRDTASFLPVARLEGHTRSVSCLAYSSDGTRIVSGSADRTVRIWNSVTFEEIKKLGGHQKGVSCVAISHNGALIVSGSHDFIMRVWDATTFQPLTIFLMDHGKASSVCFSRDDSRIIARSGNGTWQEWDTISFEPLARRLTTESRPWRSAEETVEYTTTSETVMWPTISIVSSGWLECIPFGGGPTVRLLWLPLERRKEWWLRHTASSGWRFAIAVQGGPTTLLDFSQMAHMFAAS